MNNFFDFIDKHKFGILIAVLAYIGIFIYSQIETFPKEYRISVWDERTKLEKEEIEIQPENIELQPQVNANGEIKNIASDVNDQREKSYENWDENKASKSSASLDQRIKDLEKQYYSESGESAKREKIQQEIDKLKKNETKNNPDTKTNTNTQGGEKAYAGKTMVSFDLDKRDAFQGNKWYVRNPGYTCGEGSSGEVVIKIKVEQSGNVISATYAPELSSGANPCMIDQAKKYAKLSRFNYSASAPKVQEGTISYVFISQ